MKTPKLELVTLGALLLAGGSMAGAATAPLVDTAPVPLVAGAIELPTQPSHDGKTWFNVRNSSDRPLVINNISASDIVRTSGSGRATPNITPLVTSTCGKGAFTVAARNVCRFDVDLKTDDGAGRYDVVLTLVGAAGEAQRLTLIFEERAAWGYAALMILLGVGLGAFVGWWRSDGERRWGDLITIRSALEAAQSKHEGTSHADDIEPLVTAGQNIADRVAQGAAYDSAEIDEFRRRVAFLGYFLRLESGRQKAAAATTEAIELISPSPEGAILPAVSADAVSAAGKKVLAALGSVETAFQSSDMRLPVDARSSIPTLKSRASTFKAVAGILLIAVFVLVAFQTIYVSPTWGSLGDFVAALLIGFAAYAGSAPGVSGLLSSARKVPS